MPERNFHKKIEKKKKTATSTLENLLSDKKIAVVHDWLNGMRGGELVLENILKFLPQDTAQIFTLVSRPEKLSSFINSFKINTSFIQKLPFSKNKYRSYLPLFPMAIETFDFSDFDLVLSTSHCVAKGVITPTDIYHISYIHSPMRYVWDLYYNYFPSKKSRIKGKKVNSFLSRLLITFFSNYLRIWDTSSSSRADLFIANSDYIKRRVMKFYSKDAKRVYPPCGSLDNFKTRLKVSHQKEDYYLIVSAFAPYKRIDLAVESFKKIGKKLIIIGGGQDEKYIKNLCKDAPNIEFMGYLDRENTLDYMMRARGFVFPGIEDFGISLVEAQSFGTPVIAYARGGALESVIPRKTGVLFNKQETGSLINAIEEFECIQFKNNDFYNNIKRFSTEAFRENYAKEVLKVL